MQVTKLRLSGFKSFGQPTELLIEPGLTGIVGPNGCGKSNLMDALRWVMGETSARGLRGGEMDDVIFAGTAARPPFDLAEVCMQIRGAAFPVPGLGEVDELELSRRIGRGTGSVYRVNGKELRARDVQLLFADSASGARSAALVSQGRIGALVDAKPQERRRLLEEAAGIGGLQARRHEAELKLQAAEANLVRVADLLTTLGEQHRGLRKQAREAVRYRELSAARRETEAALLTRRWQMARADLDAAERGLREGQAVVEARSTRLAAARAERDRTAAALAELRQREAALAAEHARLGERRRAALEETARLEADRARLHDQDQQLVRDLGDAETTLADARASGERLAAEQRTLAAAREERTALCARATAAETAAASTVDAAETELRAALAAHAAIEAKVGQLTEERAQIAHQLGALDATEQEVRAGLAEIEAQQPPPAGLPTAEVEAEVRAAEATLETVEAALDEANHRLEASRGRVTTATAALGAHQDRLRTAEDEQRRAAEQREARLERVQEIERRAERLGGRLLELAAALEDRTGQRRALGLEVQEAAFEVAQTRLAAADGALEQARAARAAAEAGLSVARSVEQAARGALQKLEAEAEALAELAGPDADGGVIDQIEVDDGYADALGAALGDDLLGGLDPTTPSHWRGDLDATADAPRLPPGCPSLADVVRAPAALARRLAQVGVVEAGAAGEVQRRLAQGQRLVSRDGGLWRWDGFVRRPDPERGAAARLQQRARRRVLEREIAAAAREALAAEHELAAAGARVAAAGEERERAEAGAEAARAEVDLARAAALEAGARDGALAAELTALAQEQAQTLAEQAELAAARAALGEDRDGRDEIEAQVSALSAAVRDAEALREAQLGAERAAQVAQVEARAAHASAREQLAAARAELDRRYQAERAITAEVREREVARAQLEARLARIADERAALERRRAAVEGAWQTIEDDRAAARTRRDEAEQAAAGHRTRHAEARMEEARARDRLSADEARATALAAETLLWSERATAGEARLAELARRRTELARDLASLQEAPATLARQRAELEAELAGVEARRGELGAALATADAAFTDAQAGLDAAETERVEAREGGARSEARLERAQAEHAQAEGALRARLGEVPAAPEDEPPSAGEMAELEAELARLGAARERLGAVNLRAIDEAEELSLRIRDLEAEQAELTGAIERLRRAISTLNREGRERLRAAFAKVEEHFEALFVRMFGGGRARLSLTDLEDPLAAGLELAASPPGKKLQSISLLSGGEKALTALALIFAVFLTQPAPLCVLDEVDAPLDDANVERLLNLLVELAEGTDTRFVVITHHPLTMARMDRLYGVTMAERGLSQLVSVDLRGAVELRATA